MASQLTISPPSARARSIAAAVLPDAVGPNTAITRVMRSHRDGGGLTARQRLRRRPVDLDQHEIALGRVAPEERGLVAPGAASQHVGIRPARALDQHLL